MTVGVEFYTTTLPSPVGKISIWDAAGADRFRSVTKSYYRNLDHIWFVYSHDSYESIRPWLEDFRLVNGDDWVSTTLVRTKRDSCRDQTPSMAVKEFMKDHGLNHYMETSSVAQSQEHLIAETVRVLGPSRRPHLKPESSLSLHTIDLTSEASDEPGVSISPRRLCCY